MDYSDFEDLHVEVVDGIGRFQVTRPERLNALSRQTLLDLAAAARWFDEQRDVRVVVVKGEGRSFSAGFDLNDWNGLFAATGTPPEAIARMQQVCAEAITDAKVREKLDAAGAVLVANSPADFKTWLDGQREVLGALIKSADIKLG